MSVVDIYCGKSISFSNSLANLGNKELYIGSKYGYGYWTYMYFDLKAIQSSSHIKSAKIILFKLPVTGEAYEKYMRSDQYKVVPLLDYVSPYTYSYHSPYVDERLEHTFKVNENLSYTEVDITPILKEWLEEKIENRGVLLLGEKNSKWIVYGSEKLCNREMRPFLRVKYTQTNQACPYLHEPEIVLPCQVRILT